MLVRVASVAVAAVAALLWVVVANHKLWYRRITVERGLLPRAPALRDMPSGSVLFFTVHPGYKRDKTVALANTFRWWSDSVWHHVALLLRNPRKPDDPWIVEMHRTGPTLVPASTLVNRRHFRGGISAAMCINKIPDEAAMPPRRRSEIDGDG